MAIQVLEPERTETAQLPDGRLLGWAEWGPTSGTPVLFCSGAAMGRSLGFGAGVLEKRNVRLIAVDRPGLGASTPAPGRGLLDWSADIQHFAEARGLKRLSAVGYSQGAPFALACAARGMVSAVAIVAGGDELAHPAARGLLHPEVAKLVELTVSEPARAEGVFAGMTAQKLWEMVIGMSSESDRAVFSEPRFASAYRRALGEGFSQGPAGYARDTVLHMSRWPFELESLRAPVDLWYGALDTSPVHSPDFGETLARRLPEARRQLLPHVGSALLWTHAEDILGSLLSRY